MWEAAVPATIARMAASHNGLPQRPPTTASYNGLQQGPRSSGALVYGIL